MFANPRDFREKSEGCRVTGSGPKRRLLIFRERIADFSVDGGIPSLGAALAAQKLVLCTGGSVERARFQNKSLKGEGIIVGSPIPLWPA